MNRAERRRRKHRPALKDPPPWVLADRDKSTKERPIDSAKGRS